MTQDDGTTKGLAIEHTTGVSTVALGNFLVPKFSYVNNSPQVPILGKHTLTIALQETATATATAITVGRYRVPILLWDETCEEAKTWTTDDYNTLVAPQVLTLGTTLADTTVTSSTSPTDPSYIGCQEGVATHSRDSVSDPALTDEMVAVNYDTGEVTIK